MELLHERCAALDIGKKDLKACVRTPSPNGKRSRRQEIRTFATTTNALLEMRDWLVGERVSIEPQAFPTADRFNAGRSDPVPLPPLMEP